MARPLVLCLDAGRLLKPPCPVLFPEWGDELLVLSPGMTLGDWSRCASAISAADGDGTSVEVWQLVRAGLWNGRVQAVDALLNGVPPQLRERLLNATRVVAWTDGVAGDLGGADVVIGTEFEGDPPPAALPLSQRYLLPIGIRVLLDSAELLRAMSFPSRPLRSVTILAVGDVLLAAELDWAKRLTASRDALTTQRETERTRACDQSCLDPERFAGLDATFDVEPPTPLPLRLFQRLGFDDRAVAAWFAAEAERIERADEKHRSELAQQMEQAIRQLALARPAPMAGAAETRTCEAVRDSIRTELARESRSDRHSAQEVNEPQELRQWGATHRVAVLRAARRRVTARVFWVATSMAAVAVALVNSIGRGTPTSASWDWPDLIMPTVLSMAALGALAVAVAGWFWARARAAVRAAADAASQLTQRLRDKADTAVRDATSNVRRMAMMRNLVLLDRACEEQSAHVARIDAHVDAVLKLLEALGSVPSNSVGYVEPVDTDQRPESAHAYEWATDSPRVTIRMGADAWDASNTSFQGLLRRYAGVSTIEIECQP